METTTERIPVGKLVWGLALLGFGILALTDDWRLHDLWRWWPLFLIVLGAATEFDALRARRGGGGFVLIAVGVWFLAGSNHFFGLGPRTAWPLAVMVAGVGVVTHALIDRRNVSENDEQH